MSNARRGSKVTDRAILRAAAKGYRVRVHLDQNWMVTGYVAGLDDYHVKLVDSYGNIYLAHKSAPLVEVVELDTNPPPNVEEIVSSFRNYATEALNGQETESC